jgi:hypothetical protein
VSWFEKPQRGLAEPLTVDKIDRMVALLSEARDLAGSMRMSSKNMALCVSIYQALCVAKTYKADGEIL